MWVTKTDTFRTKFLMEMGLWGKPVNFPSLRALKKGSAGSIVSESLRCGSSHVSFQAQLWVTFLKDWRAESRPDRHLATLPATHPPFPSRLGVLGESAHSEARPPPE